MLDTEVILSSFDRQHLAATLKWVNDPRIMNTINRVLPVNMIQHEKWFERVTHDSSQLVFSILEQETMSHIGNCGLSNIDWRVRKAELWVYLDPDHWGKSWGVAAVRKLLDFAFSSLNLHRIFLYAIDNNCAAHATFRKAGFSEEGLFRDDVFLNGTYHNSIRMAILHTDWRKIRGEETRL